jgi:hypothetical protein
MTHYAFITLVTDEPPRVKLGGRTGVSIAPLIKFGPASAATGTFDVQLPNSMTPDAKAAWCIGFAKDLTDLAADIQSKAATVTA